MEIRAKLSLNSSNAISGLDKAAGAVKAFGYEAANATKKSSSGLSEVEKTSIRTSEALRNLKKEQARQAVPGGRYAKEARDAAEYFRAEKAAAKEARDQSKAFHRAEIKQQADYFNQNEQQLASTRYALYDVGRRAIAFGTAITAGITSTIVAAAKFESAFTSVERTTGLAGDAAKVLKDTLIEMSTVIPVSFEELTKIATLGAQLGIAADDVDNFTETVARFAAITGISVDQVGLSFGRLAQLIKVPVSEFENLSSAIAFTGVNAVATDAEILKMAESIGAAASMAGMSADEIVGLGSALASLKVRPEQARGVFIRLFRIFDTEAAGATETMDDLARVVGLTTQEAIKLYQTDPSQFFQQFLAGAEAAGTLNQTMAALGITNVRELDVIQRLAGNQDVLTKALSDSREQYLLGTYSSEAYGKVQDDLLSKVTMMQNAVEALAASFGETFAPGVGAVVDTITALAKILAETPASVKILLGIISAITAATALFFGSIALGIAGLLALKLAFKGLGDETIKAGISLTTLKALLISMVPDAGAASAAMTILGLKAEQGARSFTKLGLSARGAWLSVLGGLGLIVTTVIAIAEITNANQKASDSFKELGSAALEANGGLSEAMDALNKDAQSGAEAINTIDLAVKQQGENADATKESVLAYADSIDKLTRAGSQGELGKSFDLTTGAIDSQNESLKENEQLLNVDGPAADSAGAAKQGEEYVKWLAKGARKYAKDDGSMGDIAVDLATMDSAQKAVLEGLGFDFMQIFNSSVEDAAGNATGGQAYVESFQGTLDRLSGFITSSAFDTGSFSDVLAQAIDIGYVDETLGPVLQKAFDESGKSVAEFAISLASLPPGLLATATSADAMNFSVKENIAANELWAAGIGETGDDIDVLNEKLRENIDNLTATSLTQAKISDSLNAFAESAKNTGGELDGMGNSAKENLSNFAAFMDAATEASIAAGEGTEGAVARIIGGLNSLDAAGIDTSDAFQLVQTMIITSMSNISYADAELKRNLAQAPNLSGMKKVIDAFYIGRLAAEGYSEIIITEWNNIIRLLDSTGPAIEFKPITGAVKKALTELEKLQQKISNVFKFKDVYVELYDSLDTLKQSFEKNGKTFSVYSEAGRSNITSLQSTIDMFAVKSGGNVTKFANDLASLRAALVRTGAPVSALKMIDDVVKKIGVTGKESSHNVNKFADALKSTGDSVRQLYAVKTAMDAITSGLRQGFSALFAQADALDSVTLGWLDMSDAADAARESITNAKADIRDARLEIEKLGAEIDGLAADKGKLQYQLSIALKYGDTLRANELRAEIAQLDADVAAKEASISDAQGSISQSTQQIADANGILGSNPSIRQQIERNNALRDMALRYGDVAASMMAAAEPGADLNQIIEDQVTAFYDSAVEMGYSETAAQEMADVLRDELIYQMNQIPEDITTDITAETSVATAAVSKFVEYANNRLKQIKDKTVTVTTRMITYTSTVSGTSSNPTHWSTGGYIRGPGTGTSDSIPARLSNGEYVIKAAAVSKYGVDFFNSLNQMQGAPPARAGSAVSQSSGGGTVYLSTEDRQLLRAAIDRPITLYTDNATIAKSANEGNSILAQRGIR